MNNMFGEYEVDLRYDLKGSTKGRTTKFVDGEEPDRTVALKDNNFISENNPFMLDHQERAHLLDTLRKASDFLGVSQILDYSALVGVVNLEKRRKLLRHRMIDPDDPIVDLLRDNPDKPPYRGMYFSKDKNYLYIVGVIDTLTNYTKKKRVEYFYKRMIGNGLRMS